VIDVTAEEAEFDGENYDFLSVASDAFIWLV
jgi:hypothetical protein